MRLVLTALIFLAGLLDLLLAIGFLTDPATNAAQLGVLADGTAGLSTIRADFTAFFLVAAGCMMWGAWRRNFDLLLVPAALFGVALTGRAINLAIHGAYPGFVLPMTVEAFHVVLLVVAWRVLPHHTVEEIAG
jgi:hypothetical protein